MNYLIYHLQSNTPVDRWLVAGTFEQEKEFEKITMDYSGDLNKWLTEGFSIFENPSRKEFIDLENKVEKEKIKTEKIYLGESLQYGSSTKEWQVYFPWKNKKVERSGFWQQPTHLKAWAFTNIHSKIARKVPFVLSTCGSVVLWINGEKILQFSPYTRNEEKEIQFEANLREGKNEFIILFEDLAERDTLFYFRLDYFGKDNLEMILPVGNIKPESIKALEDSLGNAYFESDVIKTGDVKIHFENPLEKEIHLKCALKSEWWDEKREFKKVIAPGEKNAVLGKVEEMGMGNSLLTISVQHQNVILHKDMFIQLYPEKMIPTGSKDSLLSRRNQTLNFIAEFGKKDMHRAYALVKTGRELGLAETLVRETLDDINRRFDCSDFYLNQLFRFWIEFRETDLFYEDFWMKCKQAILNYRYWFDEPGNDVMWFFSENHALLFHTCEYLAGQLFPNEIFPNSEISGFEHMKKAKSRLFKWFEKFNEEGLAEWNSSAYIPINVMGFLQIYDLIEDMELKRAAKKALDTTFRLLAINSFNGYLSCSQGRIYEKELKGNYNNATTSLLWMAYGVGNLNNATFATTSFSVSEYKPPNYMDLLNLKPDENLLFRNSQGSKGFVDLYTFKNNYGLLSSAIEYRPGVKGYSEHVIHSILSPEAMIWINHPGEEAELGTGRPSFWAGNGRLPKVDQYQDIAFVHFKINQEDEIHYTHAYFPIAAFDQIVIDNNWCFGRIGDSFVALYAKNGLVLQEAGQYKNRELISLGRDNIWILRNSHIRQFPTFEHFIESMKRAEMELSEDHILFYDPVHGVVESPWQGPLKANGEIRSNTDQGTMGAIEKWVISDMKI
ncbi:hypothetical protein [Lederbergia ruris]|uniref:hypothetical protein n=1 Tax=Lederbergia ruris TaxID=217495 RepID=UPI0039A2E674